jgi:hypothetical protein
VKRLSIVLVLIAALLVGVVSPNLAGQVSAAPAGSHAAAVHTQSHPAAFDKTKFVLHLAVAAFLIHYIYNKYKQHKLGRLHIFTDIKAAAAALIAYHELRVAYDLANKSNSKTLHVLVAPINALLTAINSTISKLKHGDTSSVSSLNGSEGGFATLAAKNGFGFKDTAPSSGFSGF